MNDIKDAISAYLEADGLTAKLAAIASHKVILLTSEAERLVAEQDNKLYFAPEIQAALLKTCREQGLEKGAETFAIELVKLWLNQNTLGDKESLLHSWTDPLLGDHARVWLESSNREASTPELAALIAWNLRLLNRCRISGIKVGTLEHREVEKREIWAELQELGRHDKFFGVWKRIAFLLNLLSLHVPDDDVEFIMLSSKLHFGLGEQISERWIYAPDHSRESVSSDEIKDILNSVHDLYTHSLNGYHRIGWALGATKVAKKKLDLYEWQLGSGFLSHAEAERQWAENDLPVWAFLTWIDDRVRNDRLRFFLDWEFILNKADVYDRLADFAEKDSTPLKSCASTCRSFLLAWRTFGSQSPSALDMRSVIYNLGSKNLDIVNAGYTLLNRLKETDASAWQTTADTQKSYILLMQGIALCGDTILRETAWRHLSAALQIARRLESFELIAETSRSLAYFMKLCPNHDQANAIRRLYLIRESLEAKFAMSSRGNPRDRLRLVRQNAVELPLRSLRDHNFTFIAGLGPECAALGLETGDIELAIEMLEGTRAIQLSVVLQEETVPESSSAFKQLRATRQHLNELYGLIHQLRDPIPQRILQMDGSDGFRRAAMVLELELLKQKEDLWYIENSKNYPDNSLAKPFKSLAQDDLLKKIEALADDTALLNKAELSNRKSLLTQYRAALIEEAQRRVSYDATVRECQAAFESYWEIRRKCGLDDLSISVPEPAALTEALAGAALMQAVPGRDGGWLLVLASGADNWQAIPVEGLTTGAVSAVTSRYFAHVDRFQSNQLPDGNTPQAGDRYAAVNAFSQVLEAALLPGDFQVSGIWDLITGPIHRALQTAGLMPAAGAAIAPEVVLCLPAELAMLPISAACDPSSGRPFYEDYALRLVPSLGALVASASRARRPEQRTIVAVTDPLDDLQINRNPAAELFPHAAMTELTGYRFDPKSRNVATWTGLSAAIESVRPGYIAYYGHSHWNQRDGEGSGLALAPELDTEGKIPGRSYIDSYGNERVKVSQDLATPSRIRSLALSSTRLVFSASCGGAGLSLAIARDEMGGLPAAWLEAGAAGMISSLYSVLTGPAAFVMHETFAAMLSEGQPPVQALRRAQMALAHAFKEEETANVENTPGTKTNTGAIATSFLDASRPSEQTISDTHPAKTLRQSLRAAKLHPTAHLAAFVLVGT